MRGRPPKTKHQLQIAGSWRANEREELGTAPSEPMQPPDWLNDRGKEVFRGVAGWLSRMGTLAESDGPVIARYALVYVKWEFAAAELQNVDTMFVEVLGPDGSLRFTRPTGLATQAKECGEQLRHLETVLGLTPADRTRLGFGAVKVTDDPGEAMFRGVPAAS